MHALERSTNGHTSFAFTGKREDIWHRLGQQFDGSLMSTDEVMSLANMDRELTFEEVALPIDTQLAEGLPPQWLAVLDGKQGISPEGDLWELPRKVVGFGGEQWMLGQRGLSIRDRMELAELAIRASQGEAVWTTAGMLRGGRVGFAVMEAPPIIVDPNGVNDIVRSYLTVQWSFDGTRATELGASHIRVVCANTLAVHDGQKLPIIKVKSTRNAKERYELAAAHWGMAQDAAQATKLRAERLLAKAEGNGKKVLLGIVENVLKIQPNKLEDGRQKTIQSNKLDEIMTLYSASTNSEAVGDNAYAAVQTAVEWLDWFSPVKGEDKLSSHLAAQFDGTHAQVKQAAEAYALSV